MLYSDSVRRFFRLHLNKVQRVRSCWFSVRLLFVYILLSIFLSVPILYRHAPFFSKYFTYAVASYRLPFSIFRIIDTHTSAASNMKLDIRIHVDML